MKKLVLLLLLALGVGASFVPAFADDAQDSRQFADTLSHKALSIVTDKTQGDDAKRKALETLFAENFDIDWVARFVLGRAWRDATPEQRTRYTANYRTFTVTHYTSNLAEFSNANFSVTRIRPEQSGGGQVVTMHIQRPGSEDTVLEYTIRRKDGAFKVYDIAVEGVSLITTQRSEFSSVVSQKGLDYLIEQLAARSKADAAGAH